MPITLKERPVIMIGAERSGTTLVMAMLGCHPRIAVPEVVWYYPRFRPYLHTYGDLSKDQNFRALAEEMAFGLKTPFWGMKANPRTIVDEILADLKEKSFAGIYCAMHERYARIAGKPRWGEKTPHNLFFVKEILEDFPNAQFIFITRDGRDASADYLDSAFGPTNIFCAGESWALCQNAVKPWRKKLAAEPLRLGEEQIALWRELDGRTRAATMDAPEGHIVYESYNDWLVDQREERKRRGLWKDSDAPKNAFPIGHPHEEMITGQRAWRYWKDYLCV